MARRGAYKIDKRQKELAKQKKRREKLERKHNRSAQRDETIPESGDPQPPGNPGEAD